MPCGTRTIQLALCTIAHTGPSLRGRSARPMRDERYGIQHPSIPPCRQIAYLGAGYALLQAADGTGHTCGPLYSIRKK